MPAIRPLPPQRVLEIMVGDGWRMVETTRYNCLLEKAGFDEPFLLPMRGKLLAVPIMDQVAERVGHAKLVAG